MIEISINDRENIFTKFGLIAKMFLPLQPKKIEVEIDKIQVSNGFDEISTRAEWRNKGFS